jgi:glyoxylase-like metal-dependent hydrolase (beta-lactamase superfamily II)
MVLVSEVAEKIYEIQPEGNELDRFPLCTVYLMIDEKAALVETGCPGQITDILKAVEGLGYNIRNLSYIIPTHVHIDHGGAAGHLAQLLPQARVVAHPKAGRLFSDPIILDKLMQGFMRTFGKNARQRFGGVIPVPEESFKFVEDGERISLGNRALQVIHTPGHDPNHLSFLDTKTRGLFFLDTKTRGLFCGDALGSYFSEIDVTMPPLAPATDPFLILQSITKLQKFNPEIIYFSHGKTTNRASEIIQGYLDDARLCAEVALNALKKGESDEKIASKLTDVLAKNSAKAKEELLAWPYFIPTVVEGYRQYFNRSKK